MHVTDESCTECGRSGVPVIEFGEPMAVESDTAWLCLACAKALIDILETALAKTERIVRMAHAGSLRRHTTHTNYAITYKVARAFEPM